MDSARSETKLDLYNSCSKLTSIWWCCCTDLSFHNKSLEQLWNGVCEPFFVVVVSEERPAGRALRTVFSRDIYCSFWSFETRKNRKSSPLRSLILGIFRDFLKLYISSWWTHGLFNLWLWLKWQKKNLKGLKQINVASFIIKKDANSESYSVF